MSVLSETIQSECEEYILAYEESSLPYTFARIKADADFPRTDSKEEYLMNIYARERYEEKIEQELDSIKAKETTYLLKS